MVRRIRYLTHPQVAIDPTVDVPRWSLNDVGRQRVADLADSGGLAGTTLVISSDETKARETARPLADSLGCELVVGAEMHENDRSATGFLPSDAFERAADAFFAHPDQSYRGWETALAAQSRIVAAFERACAAHPTGDLLLVGHGGVGTLLYCHLMDTPIDRMHDQGPGGGGCYFELTTDIMRPTSGWIPMEALTPGRD